MQKASLVKKLEQIIKKIENFGIRGPNALHYYRIPYYNWTILDHFGSFWTISGHLGPRMPEILDFFEPNT